MKEVLEIKLWTCEKVDNEICLHINKVGDDKALCYKSCAYIDNFYMNSVHYFVVIVSIVSKLHISKNNLTYQTGLLVC